MFRDDFCKEALIIDRQLLKIFWNCGDNHIIEFEIERAHLNRFERETVRLLLDECLTQEEAAETMDIAPRSVQAYWYGAADK